MRILYHHRTQAEDAQGIHIYEMVKAFRELGHEVEMAAIVKRKGTGGRKIRGSRWKLLIRWVPNWFYELMGLGYNLYGYLILSLSIKENRPDLIYERYSLNTFCGVWVSHRFGIPLVLEINAPLRYEEDKLGKLTFKTLASFSERWICSNSTWTVVVSNVMREFLRREGVPDRKMIVIPNGIDPEKFRPTISGEAVRQRYGVKDKLVIGFVGWFRPWHGLEMLLKIMHEEQLAKKGVHILLIGDGPAYSDLHSYAKTNHLLSAVSFSGPVERAEIAEYIAAMDIAVQPSATEYACPIKIIEYMAMGKCIIAPDQPNIREFIENNVNGYLFKPEHKDCFKSTLLSIIENPALRESVQTKACETIIKREYLWLANARKVMDLVFGDTEQQQIAQSSDRNIAVSCEDPS